jgi:hypothetical protein
MQHVLHVNNTGRDTIAYELIIIYIKQNCISSKFQKLEQTLGHLNLLRST